MPELSIEERVRNLIVDQLGVMPEDISDDSILVDDLGADSLDLVELGQCVEDLCGCEIPDEELEKIRTVGELIEFVKGKTK